MKKSIKVFLIILGFIVLLVGIDIESILLRNKPIFAINSNCKCGYQKYLGLLYDTYNRPESSKAKIKAKWDNYECSDFKIKTNETDGGWYNEVSSKTD